MNVPRSVLVLDGTPRTILAASRSLHRRAIPVICAGLGRSGLGLHSKSICADVALPASEPSFYGALHDLLSKHDVDTVFPCSDKALMLLLPHFPELAGRVSLSCPEPHIVELVLQKSATLEIAARCGIPTPPTCIVNGPAALTNVLGALRFPIVGKPCEAGPSHRIKVAYFDRYEEVEEFSQTPDFRGAFVFQEFFDGEGVGISTIVGGEGPLIFFQHRRLHEYPPAGGVGVLLETQKVEPELAIAAGALLKALDWRGPAMVEFRRNRTTQDYAFMEVNGRFWGSLPLASLAGLDFPYWQWQLAHSITPEIPTDYAHGLRVRWTAGEIQRFADLLTSGSTRRRAGLTVLSSFSSLANSFEPRTKSALFSITDPQPELRDVASTILRVTASIALRASQKILPNNLALVLLQLRLLDPEYRRTYVSRSLQRALGARGKDWPRRLQGIRRVTFLCRANRIRSPIAAAILNSELKSKGDGSFQAESAGTHASVETRYDPRVALLARAMGLSLSGAPRGVTPELIQNSDLVVVMDRMVEAELLTNIPEAAAKTFLVGEVVTPEGRRSVEIPDPDRNAPPQFERVILDLAISVRQMARLFS